MKIAYLIDTNIFILLFNNRLQEPIPEGELSYSVITEIELLSFPNLSKEDEALIQQHLTLLQRVAIDREVAQKTILLRRKYRLKTPDAIRTYALTHNPKCAYVSSDSHSYSY